MVQPVFLNAFDIVLSDMAPHTSGIRSLDGNNSLELCYGALTIAQAVLSNNGAMVIKIFQSEVSDDFYTQLKPNFRNIHTFKPVSSRFESKEMFIIAKGFKRLDHPKHKKALEAATADNAVTAASASAPAAAAAAPQAKAQLHMKERKNARNQAHAQTGEDAKQTPNKTKKH